MFRISAFVSDLLQPTPPVPRRDPPGPVVIWNLIRRCNLQCRHCYSASVDKDFPGELRYEEICAVMDDLHAFGVRALILSGGEPLLHPRIFDIARRAKALGFYVGLSTNGTLINEENIASIADCGFDYVGISLDGLGATHDRFRGQAGAFAASLEGIRLCRERALKVGIRYTMTQGNAADLPGLLDLLDTSGVDRFYFSHLNYAGRGLRNRGEDSPPPHDASGHGAGFSRPAWPMRPQAGPRIHLGQQRCGRGLLPALGAAPLSVACRPHRGQAAELGRQCFRRERRQHRQPGQCPRGYHGGTTLWGTCGCGRFPEIWSNPDEPLLQVLRRRPPAGQGRCAGCAYLDICNGNTRIRAEKQSGDLWAEDPGAI